MSKQEEAHALQSLRDTTGWKLVETQIRQQIEYHRERLLDCESWEKVLEHRGEVKALEAVIVFVEQTIREGVEEANGEEIS